MKDKYHEQWEHLGAVDPYWAVLTNPKKRGGKWEPDEFFQTGEQEIATLLAMMDDVGISTTYGTVLDFGSGVGRLSRALATRFNEVLAVDVSQSMLDEARAANHHIGNIEFIHNVAEDLSVIADDSIDCLYTSMVLQHMPKERQLGYIREFCRILRPKGILAMWSQSRSNLRSWKGWLYLLAGNVGLDFMNKILYGTSGLMEMHTIPQKTVLETQGLGHMTVRHMKSQAPARSTFKQCLYIAEKLESPDEENWPA
ncbi:MAG: class I SAM-dependent methyltransferase [Gammaproteobacteria bacterium]|nr:class I SAM-dependent methyltransferase [Gammaproteobacteria bacterium]